MIRLSPYLELYRTHVERIAMLLDLPDVTMDVSWFWGSFADLTNPTNCYIDLNEMNIVRAIAHEMRHLYQFKHGWLTAATFRQSWVGYAAVWRGELIERQVYSQAEYEQLPWERDPNEWADWYCGEHGGQVAKAA